MSDKVHEETLKQFRKALYDEGILHDGDTIGTNDEALLPFLRVCRFDLVQAKKLFKDCQYWRKTVEGVGIDELYRQVDPFDYPEREAVFDYWPMSYHKTDKQGRPVVIQILGDLDLKKLYHHCTPEKFRQVIIVNGESLIREAFPAASRKAGKEVGESMFIVDLRGFRLSQFWQMNSLIRDCIHIGQDYYPERVGKVVAINAPSTIAIIWGVVKPLLSKEVVNRVDIQGSDYKDVLLKLIDAENLPSFLGGACTCPDAGGCRLSGAGPWLEGRAGWGPKAQGLMNATPDAGRGTSSSMGVNGVSPAVEDTIRP